jgi:hypothetical protein
MPFGTICATITGTKKMPPPITFEMTMAAASRGPRRRSSSGTCGGALPATTGGLSATGRKLDGG